MNIKESFEYFHNQTGVEIPYNIQHNYLDDKNNNSEFVRLFKSLIDSLERDNKPGFNILISERFANEILKVIYEIPKNERIEIVFKEISNHSFNEIKNIYLKNNELYNGVNDKPINEETEKFLLDQVFFTVNNYDLRNNKFNFKWVQKAYENLGSDSFYIKVILTLWAHCGGEGGIIIRGMKTGFNSGYAYNETSEIEFNGKIFEYMGYAFEESERPHTPILENLKK